MPAVPHLRWALTVQQPWAWAISAGLKLVENRAWVPGFERLAVGDYFVIHSGAAAPQRGDYLAMKTAARAMGREAEVPAPGGHEFSREFGMGRACAVVRYAGIARSFEEVPVAQRPWWQGGERIAWLLEDVRQLQLARAPRMTGALGLWPLKAADAARIERLLELPEEAEAWRKTA